MATFGIGVPTALTASQVLLIDIGTDIWTAIAYAWQPAKACKNKVFLSFWNVSFEKQWYSLRFTIFLIGCYIFFYCFPYFYWFLCKEILITPQKIGPRPPRKKKSPGIKKSPPPARPASSRFLPRLSFPRP